MDQKQLDELLRKYQEGTCTPEEKSLVGLFYKNLSVKEAPDFDDPQVRLREERMRQFIRTEMLKTPRTQQIIPFWKYAAAACFALVAAAGVFLFSTSIIRPDNTARLGDSPSTIENTGAEIKIVALADGSVVHLNPMAKLSVRLDSITNKRIVFLEGEAFFKIAPDKRKPFLVYTKNLVTKVLGTSFRIRSWKDEAEHTVRVEEGKVAVFSNDANPVAGREETILLPNQMAVYNQESKKVMRQIVENPVIRAGYETTMTFEEAPLVDVLKRLQQTYGVEIQYDQNAYTWCRLTSSFENESLFERLNIICAAMGATYDTVDGRIVLGPSQCVKKVSND